MTTHKLDLLTPELLTIIFSRCENLAATFALATTCRRIYQLWLDSRSIFALDLARKECTTIDEAALAAREIRLRVKWLDDHTTYQRISNLQPTLDIQTYNWRELIEAVNMHRVAALLESASGNATDNSDDYMYEYSAAYVLASHRRIYRKVRHFIQADPVDGGEYVEFWRDKHGAHDMSGDEKSPTRDKTQLQNCEKPTHPKDNAARCNLFKSTVAIFAGCVLEAEGGSGELREYFATTNRAKAFTDLKTSFGRR